MTADDMKEFALYLKGMTTAQVGYIIEKEEKANRHEYAALAYIELGHRDSRE